MGRLHGDCDTHVQAETPRNPRSSSGGGIDVAENSSRRIPADESAAAHLPEPDETDPHQPASLGDARARLQDHFNRPVRHEGRTVLATWHPSYALRAPDPAAREGAYPDIVTALKDARRLAAGK